MKRLYILAWCSVLLAGVVFLWNGGTRTTMRPGRGLLLNKEWLANPGVRLTPREHVRPPDQTFLTFPEWFLVFAPGEQADFFEQNTSSKFPFMTHVRQIWEGYAAVYDQIRGNFPFNKGYHVMIVVISTSSTAEFGLKAAYETLIGRLTDTRAGEEMTEEDKFNAWFARDYVEFIKTNPWYEFDFKTRLGTFWRETSWFGPHMLRKWERKYILTTELVVKTVYGKLIKLGTRTAYERPILKTAVVVDHVPAGVESKLPELETLKMLPGGGAVITLPRYAPCSTNLCELAEENVKFEEIAGNRSAILITILAPHEPAARLEDFRVLFTQPLPTKTGMERVALATPVNRLDETLRQLQREGAVVEHVFDF